MTARRGAVALSLLGSLRISVDGEERPIGSRRQRVLVAMLALAARSREAVIAELWPESDERRGRQNLRQALYEVGIAAQAELITVRADMLGIADGVTIDIRQLERAAAGGSDEQLRRAIALYTGDLCPEAEGPEAEGERVRLRSLFAGAAEALAVRRLEHAPREAEAIARRVIQVDPYREEAHRLILRALARSGDLAGAAAHHGRLTALLRDELGIGPSAETRRTYAALEREVVPAARAARRPPMEPPAELIGRRDEYAALMGVVIDAIDARGRSALVSGEPGAGKSRLIQEIARVAEEHDLRVLRGGAVAAEGALPFQMWIDALAPCAPDAATLPAPWPAVLSALFPELSAADAGGIAPELRRTRLFEAVARLLVHLAGRGPTLVLLDDVHQADADSLQLLHYVGRILRGRRLGLIAAARPIVADSPLDGVRLSLEARGDLRALPLGPLEAAAVGELLARFGLGEDDARWLGPSLHGWTAGNAFFVLEVLRALVDQGRLRREEGQWRWAADRPAPGEPLAPDLPPTVRGSILARVGTLPEAGRRLLDLVAVIGSPARLGTLAFVTGRDELALGEDLAPALEAGLLRETGTRAPGGLAFTHDLVADATYQRIPFAVRAAIHRRVADALEAAGGPSAAIAHHLTAAGEGARALDRWIAAGREADAGMAHEHAVRAYRAAADAAGPLSERRAEILIATGDAHMRRGAGAAAVGAYDEALAAVPAHAPELRAGIAVRIAGAARSYERHPRALELAEEAIAYYAARKDDRRRCEALVALAWVRYVDREAERAHALAEEARELARSLGEPHSEIGALRASLLARWLAGDALAAPDPADVDRLAAALGDDDSVAALFGLVAVTLMRRGDPLASASAARRGLEVARRVGSMRAQLTAGEPLVRALRVTGDLAGAIALADEILLDTAALDLPQPADLVGELLLSLAAAGDRGRALPLARDIVARHDSPVPQTHSGPTLFAASALTTLGELPDRGLIDRARPLCTSCQSGWLALAGRHAALAGEPDRALGFAEDVAGRAAAGAVYARGVPEAIRALVHARAGEADAARSMRDAAASAFRSSGQRYPADLLARDLAALGLAPAEPTEG